MRTCVHYYIHVREKVYKLYHTTPPPSTPFVLHITKKRLPRCMVTGGSPMGLGGSTLPYDSIRKCNSVLIEIVGIIRVCATPFLRSAVGTAAEYVGLLNLNDLHQRFLVYFLFHCFTMIYGCTLYVCWLLAFRVTVSPPRLKVIAVADGIKR